MKKTLVFVIGAFLLVFASLVYAGDIREVPCDNFETYTVVTTTHTMKLLIPKKSWRTGWGVLETAESNDLLVYHTTVSSTTLATTFSTHTVTTGYPYPVPKTDNPYSQPAQGYNDDIYIGSLSSGTTAYGWQMWR